MDKLKDAVKPNKHTDAGHTGGSDNGKHSSSGPTSQQPHTGEGEAYRSRPQEGVQQTRHQDTMPDNTGLRHQGQDTSGGITGALKPGTSASGHSSTKQAVKEMTDSMGSTANKPSKTFGGGLGTDPGSAGQAGL